MEHQACPFSFLIFVIYASLSSFFLAWLMTFLKITHWKRPAVDFIYFLTFCFQFQLTVSLCVYVSVCDLCVCMICVCVWFHVLCFLWNFKTINFRSFFFSNICVLWHKFPSKQYIYYFPNDFDTCIFSVSSSKYT